jgi:hypothetical protein
MTGKDPSSFLPTGGRTNIEVNAVDVYRGETRTFTMGVRLP